MFVCVFFVVKKLLQKLIFDPEDGPLEEKNPSIFEGSMLIFMAVPGGPRVQL